MSFISLYCVLSEVRECSHGEWIQRPVLDQTSQQELPQLEQLHLVHPGQADEALLDQVVVAHRLLTLGIVAPRV